MVVNRWDNSLLDYPMRFARAVELLEFLDNKINYVMSILNPVDGYFPITTIHRDDLEGLGYDVSKVDDADMERLASKMADAYLDNGFWIDLPILADHLGIPKKSV